MKVTLKVKQDKIVEPVELNKVKHHHFDKNYLVLTDDKNNRHMFKISTVLEIREEK